MTSKKVAQKHFGKKQILPQKYAFDVMLLLAIFKPKAASKPKIVRFFLLNQWEKLFEYIYLLYFSLKAHKRGILHKFARN